MSQDTDPFVGITNKKLIDELAERGYFVSKVPQTVSGKTFEAEINATKGRKYRFAVISCTQIGSKYQQMTHLYSFYKLLQRRKITTVYHCGDVVDGERVYRGQEYELFVHGAHEQADYVIQNYPRYKGIKTYFIMGNHDESFWKYAGVNICRMIADGRDDMEYLGDYLAFVKLDGIRIALMHGGGGVAYARSYKTQKIIEQFAPDVKPHMLFVGHWHVTNVLPMYRNVVGIMAGCFQSQTPFLSRLGLYPEIGGYIVELILNDSGIASLKTEWIPFYVPKKNDY